MCLSTSRSRSQVCVFLPQRFWLQVDSPTSNPAANLSQVCPPFPYCSLFQIQSSWQPRIALTDSYWAYWWSWRKEARISHFSHESWCLICRFSGNRNSILVDVPLWQIFSREAHIPNQIWESLFLRLETGKEIRTSASLHIHLPTYKGLREKEQSLPCFLRAWTNMRFLRTAFQLISTLFNCEGQEHIYLRW